MNFVHKTTAVVWFTHGTAGHGALWSRLHVDVETRGPPVALTDGVTDSTVTAEGKRTKLHMDRHGMGASLWQTS